MTVAMQMDEKAEALPTGLRLPAAPQWLLTLLGLVLILIGWEVLARTTLAGMYILAGPVEIAQRIVAQHDFFGRSLSTTLGEALWGFLWGNVAAVALAALVAVAPRLERVVQGLALVVFCLPLVATGPILRVLYGPGQGPQVMLAALAVYYTTFVPLVVGLRAVPGTWLDLVQSYGRGRFTAFVVVRVRASVPYLVAGLQIAAPSAFLGAMVGEFTGAERGMGVVSIETMRSLDVVGTWALATIATAVAIAGYLLVGGIGRLLSIGKPPMLLAGPAGQGRAPIGIAFEFAITVALVLLLWDGLIRGFGLNVFFAKKPLDVFGFLFTGEAAADNRATLLEALGGTLAVTVPGYVAGIAAGALLAGLFNLLPTLGRVVTPVAIALRSIPIVATVPLIVMAVGRGPAGTITIVAVMSFFPTFVACAQGLRQAPGQVLDFFAVFSTGRLTTLWFAQVPAMLPALFAAARMAVPSAVLAATVAEWLATGTGVGNLMALTASTSSYGMLWSAVAALTAIAILGYALVGVVERQVLLRFAPEQVSR